jgi:hypothetical protein
LAFYKLACFIPATRLHFNAPASAYRRLRGVCRRAQ